jgi:hypothetical protein
MEDIITSHSLTGPLARVARAEEHLAELQRQIASLKWENMRAFIPQFDLEPPHYLKLIPIPDLMVDAQVDMGIRIGEILYNLRGALDYLVYRLWWLDSGSAPLLEDFTQFPIEGSSDRFKVRRKTWLKKIDDVHAAMIERAQPYNTVRWSKALQTFNNWDKHRGFVDIEGRVTGTAFARPIDANFDEIRAPIQRAQHPIHGEVDVKVHLSVSIQFKDGTSVPIMDALDEIKRGVAQTLADFHPEFPG